MCALENLNSSSLDAPPPSSTSLTIAATPTGVNGGRNWDIGSHGKQNQKFLVHR